MHTQSLVCGQIILAFCYQADFQCWARCHAEASASVRRAQPEVGSVFCRWARNAGRLVGGDSTGDQISRQSSRLPRRGGLQREHQHLVCALVPLHRIISQLWSMYKLPLNNNNGAWCPFSPVLSEEVCILSASGTAAILNPRYMREGCLDIGLVDHRLLFT